MIIVKKLYPSEGPDILTDFFQNISFLSLHSRNFEKMKKKRTFFSSKFSSFKIKIKFGVVAAYF